MRRESNAARGEKPKQLQALLTVRKAAPSPGEMGGGARLWAGLLGGEQDKREQRPAGNWPLPVDMGDAGTTPHSMEPPDDTMY